jgi:hypothetical protein
VPNFPVRTVFADLARFARKERRTQDFGVEERLTVKGAK